MNWKDIVKEYKISEDSDWNNPEKTKRLQELFEEMGDYIRPHILDDMSRKIQDADRRYSIEKIEELLEMLRPLDTQ